jgi:fructose-1,6-bisphosphatase/sedoheptulose 1,7-bisphosphatase-like protein
MKAEYQIHGPTEELKVNLEAAVAEKLKLMEKHSGKTVDQLVNVALKRFISHHKDFLPPEKN